jgi:hypothetical protein
VRVKIYLTSGTVPKSNRKTIEKEAQLKPLTDMHDRPFSCLGTYTSIESGGAKLVL